VSIQVVAGTQSREFLLATLDHKIEQTRMSRDRAARDDAGQAFSHDTPIAEQMALARVQAMTDVLDYLLATPPPAATHARSSDG